MKFLIRILQLLVLLELLILAAGYFVICKQGSGISFSGLAVLSVSFMTVSMLTLIIFFRGQAKEPATQAMYSLVSVTLKFLLELVLAFVWFFVAKKRGLSSVVLFFVLYLTFTMFSLLFIVKTLKNKSL